MPTKTHIPLHDGHAPADYAGGLVEVDYADEAGRDGWDALGYEPEWSPRLIYRYTPKAAEPSERALLVAYKRAYPDSDWNDEARLACAGPATIELARMIEKHEPELLADPLEALLREEIEAIGSYGGISDRLAIALRKRGVKMEGEGA